jgi:cyclophilin family peptidyl-prolyl cis-trans isomerase
LAAEAQQHKRRQRIRNGVIIVVVAGAIVGIAFAVSGGGGNKPPQTPQAKANQAAVAAGCPESTKTTVNHQKYSSAPAMTIDTSKTYTATVKTTTGSFDISLNASAAPQTVNNFVFLAQKGYYNCVIFHRVIPGFMDQTGDPTGTGQGGPGYTIADEYPAKASNPSAQYPLGSVAMANTGQPHTGGSQFFIVAGPRRRVPAQHVHAVRNRHIGYERGGRHQQTGFEERRPTRCHATHPVHFHPRVVKRRRGPIPWPPQLPPTQTARAPSSGSSTKSRR